MSPTPTPIDLGAQIIDDVLELHASRPMLLAIEVFDIVMLSQGRDEVEFDYLPVPGPGAEFEALLIAAFYPYTAEERRILDHGSDEERSALCEFDEHRGLHAQRLLLLRYELNGYQGREAWAAAFAARTVEINPTAVQRDAFALGLKLWDGDDWQMKAETVADWRNRH